MSIGPEIYTAAGIIINLIALLLAVAKILTANTETEVRQAERMVKLESDVTHLSTGVQSSGDRIERDVQTLYDLHRNHLHDFHAGNR